jgi:hypothetical protein
MENGVVGRAELKGVSREIGLVLCDSCVLVVGVTSSPSFGSKILDDLESFPCAREIVPVHISANPPLFGRGVDSSLLVSCLENRLAGFNGLVTGFSGGTGGE